MTLPCGDQAEEALPIAAYLATLVHGDGGARDVAQVLACLTPQQTTALIVVLAGLVDPDRPLGELLAWVTFNEHGHPDTPDMTEQATLRDLADSPTPTAPEDPDEVAPEGDVDEVAVNRALQGERITLTPWELVLAVAEGRRRGMSAEDIAAALRKPRAGLFRAWQRAKTEARANGRPEPALPSRSLAAA